MTKAIMILTIFLFLGCSSDSDSGSTDSGRVYQETKMQTDTLYPVSSGEKVIKTSSQARVTIIMSTDNDNIEVKVTEGSASVLK